jgi:hypothetical protein
MIRVSIGKNMNKINIIVSYVLKYSSRLQKELSNRHLFRASLNLFLSPDKSLMAVGYVMICIPLSGC